MNIEQDDRLTNEEKNLVAMGAAMGAGCRTCADKLYALALSLNIPEAMMMTALPPFPEYRERLRLFLRVRSDKIIDPTAEALFSRLFFEEAGPRRGWKVRTGKIQEKRYKHPGEVQRLIKKEGDRRRASIPACVGQNFLLYSSQGV